MNFLQIVQDVDTVLGTQGTVSSVSSASGYQQLLVKYVANAWENIQNLRKDWLFMKKSVSISLIAGQTAYTIFNVHAVVTDPVQYWVTDQFKHEDDWSSLRNINPYDWDEMDLTIAVKPLKFTILDNSNLGYLEFENPDQNYSVKAYYYAKAQVLENNTDEPYAPVEFHKLLVHTATADIAAWLGNGEAYDLHSTLADNQLGNLMRSQVPGKTAKGPKFI